MTQRFPISAFAHARAPWPRRAAPDWPRLVARMTDVRPRPDVTDKPSLPAWSPATFARGKARSRAAAEALSCLVLDYDDGTPIADAHATWADWPHVLHTSWSHRPEHPKFRVVVPLERPVRAALWPRVWAWALQRAPQIDRKCKDASRIYFLPARPSAEAPFEVLVHDEPSRLLTLDPERMPKAPEERPASTPTHQRLVRPRGARRALQHELKRSPDARRRVAGVLGAEVRGEGAQAVAKGAVCPQCGRPSVWWPIEPERMQGARCDHRNSCGWRGWLDHLVGEDRL